MQNYQGREYLAIKTFTYFIPSPPVRKNGYREKEFDKIFYELMQFGYEILEFKTQSSANGMWIICLLGATNQASSNLNLDIHQELGLNARSGDQELELDLEIED